MCDRDLLTEATWVCEFCGHHWNEGRLRGDDPERCENCGHRHLRGFVSADTQAEEFAEEIHQRNQALRRAPRVSGRGRRNDQGTGQG